jgi:predicted PurR-regulated permease PerM
MLIKLPYYVKFVIVLLGMVLIVFIMREAKSILVPLLISGLLAILISPFTSMLIKFKIPKALAVGISVIFLLAVLTGLVYFFYHQVMRFSGDVGALQERITEYINLLNGYLLRNFEDPPQISNDSIQTAILNHINENTSSLTQGLISTAGTVTMVFIMPVYIFLFLYYRTFLIEFILMSFDDRHRIKVGKVIPNVKLVVQNYISGMFLVILILAVLNSIALLSLGIRHAFLFAGFAALLNVIPFLGPFIGATLPILYAFLTKDSLWYPFAVFLAFYVIQLLESNLFTPRIVGGRVSMNPLMTIIALFVGNFIWGLAGMILFIPGIAILKVILDEVEGMEAYAFLLGEAKTNKKKAAGYYSLKEQIAQVRGRFRL